MAVITHPHINEALSFEDYMELMADIAKGKPNPDYPNTDYNKYSIKNYSYSQEVLKSSMLEAKLYNLLNDLKDEWTWVVLTEPWCGDAAALVPLLYLVSQSSELIEFKILQRDKYPSVMDAYLTDGSKSIPKLICLRTGDLRELGSWGPRPKPVQEKVLAYKASPDKPFGDFIKEMLEWYREDAGQTTQKELIELIKQWMQKPQ